MINYRLGKIYKLVRKSDDVVIYVGSTCETALCKRLAKHKDTAKRCPNRKVYKSINENGGWSNHAIILIEHCDCNSKDELHRKERDFIACFKPIGNNAIPLRTRKEYYIDNIEKFEQYRVENKEKINHKINCSCGRTYTHRNKSQHNKSKIHLNNTPKPDLNIV